MGFAIALIRRKTRYLVRHSLFEWENRKDIEQDLVLRLLERRANYDPTQTPWRLFVTTVVSQGVRDMLRYRKRKKRYAENPPVSLSELVDIGEEEETELQQLVTSADQCRRLSLEPKVAQDQWEEREDLDHLIQTQLTPDEQELCRLLMRHTLSAVARLRNVPRSTLRGQLVQVREKLAGAQI